MSSDIPSSEQDLNALYRDRAKDKASLYSLYTEIEQATHGVRPARYNSLFHEDDIAVEFRSIHLAAMDLTGMTTKQFNVEVAPTGETKTRKEADEKVEKIAYAWNEGARNLGGDSWLDIMGEWARLQVLFLDACFMFLPDYETKTLFPMIRDPRNHYPPIGWTPLSIAPLNNTLIVYDTTLGQLRARYPASAGALNVQYTKSQFGPGGSRIPSDNTVCKVAEFYANEAWYVSTLGDRGVLLAASEDGDPGHPGVCPVVSSRRQGFEPIFAGQLGLEVALQKVLSQEIQATDEMLHGPVTSSPIIGGDLHNDRLNILDTSIPGERIIPPQRLAPTSPVNTQRVIGELMNMLRIANRNPESFQGQGDANSAKAVQTLQVGVKNTVQDILWPPMMAALERAYEAARKMELNLWPLDKKTVRGKKGKGFYEVSYRPVTDLADYRARIRVEHDGELGGYQGSLDRQQKHTTGFMSRVTAMEKDPDVRDVQGEIHRIEMESVEKLLDQVIAAKGPELSDAGMARWLELMGEGKSKLEAYQQAQKEGAFAPPAPPPAPPGMEMPGGMPPELAGLMGGAPEGPMPSLTEARGF